MDDNADCTLLTPEAFELRATEAIMLEGKEATFMEHIQQSDQYDNPVVKALKALDAGELCSNEWMCVEGVVLYQGRVYILDNPQCCSCWTPWMLEDTRAGVTELLVARAV